MAHPNIIPSAMVKKRMTIDFAFENRALPLDLLLSALLETKIDHRHNRHPVVSSSRVIPIAELANR